MNVKYLVAENGVKMSDGSVMMLPGKKYPVVKFETRSNELYAVAIDSEFTKCHWATVKAFSRMGAEVENQ